MDYMNNIKNRNIEYLNAIDNEFNLVCNQHTLNESGGVDLCKKGKEASDDIGLLAVIHNHPSNNPLHSQGDIDGFIIYDTKYSFVFTEENGIYIIKNKNNVDNIEQGYKYFYQKMEDHYKKNNADEYNHILFLMKNGIIKRREGKKRITKNVQKYISENKDLALTEFKQNMEKQNVPIIHIKP